MNAPSRRELNRAAQRGRILDAALRVFARDGYAGASMDAIATTAGVTKPTLYNYFDGKDALFAAMMQARGDVMLAPLTAQTEAHDMVGRLYAFAQAYAQIVMDPDMLGLTRLAIAEAQRHPEFGRAFLSSGPDQLLSGLMGYLDDLRAAGRLRFDDAELAAQDLWGLILSAPRTRALHDPEWRPGTRDLSRYIVNGLQVFLRAYATDPDTECAALSRAAAGDA